MKKDHHKGEEFVAPARWKRLLAVGPVVFYAVPCFLIPTGWLWIKHTPRWAHRLAVWAYAGSYWWYERKEGRV